MKQRNPIWGCPRIAQQIALAFHIQIDKDVVRRILAHHYLPGNQLKKRVYHAIAKLGQDRNSSKWKKEIAERHGLQFVKGKIPLPDLRIEYETREGEMARVDLELATEHYRGRHLAEKVKAGFSIYARPYFRAMSVLRGDS